MFDVIALGSNKSLPACMCGNVSLVYFSLLKLFAYIPDQTAKGLMKIYIYQSMVAENKKIFIFILLCFILLLAIPETVSKADNIT